MSLPRADPSDDGRADRPVDPRPRSETVATVSAVRDPEHSAATTTTSTVRWRAAAHIGPLLERTEDAVFHAGGLPGRTVGDTLFTRSALSATDGTRIATKATFGTTVRRSNGDEFFADILETVTFVDGSTISARGRANLSAFERHDDEIVLEVGDGTGSLAGWVGRQITAPTAGPPSRVRQTRLELLCPDPSDSGSGPVWLPPNDIETILALVSGHRHVDTSDGSRRIRVDIDVDLHRRQNGLDSDDDDPGENSPDALYIVGGSDDEARPAASFVLGRALSADRLPVAGSRPAGPVSVTGYAVGATPRALTRHAVSLVNVDGVSLAVDVAVPQAGGPPITQPLSDVDRICWGVDRGLLELIPTGHVGRHR